jgi:hypothetical protein
VRNIDICLFVMSNIQCYPFCLLIQSRLFFANKNIRLPIHPFCVVITIAYSMIQFTSELALWLVLTQVNIFLYFLESSIFSIIWSRISFIKIFTWPSISIISSSKYWFSNTITISSTSNESYIIKATSSIIKCFLNTR